MAAQRISIRECYVLVERPRNYEVRSDEQPDALMQISDACRKAECRKVLLMGVQTKVQLSTMEIFDLGKKVSQLGLKIAIVESHDAPKVDVEFFEQVVTNRGGPMRFFECVDEAKTWLGVE